MPVKILTAESLAEARVSNGTTRVSRVYSGTMEDAIRENSVIKFKLPVENGGEVEADGIPFKATSRAWLNSESRYTLLKDMKSLQDKVQNANGNVSPDTLATYFAKLFIDVQRQADDLADYSPLIYNVMDRPDSPPVVQLRDLLPYVGKEKEISGANDSVPMIEANVAQAATATHRIRAFGYKSSIYNMLFLPINEVERVTKAAAEIHVDSRNGDVIGKLVGLTYPAGQTQAAATTTGASYDEKMYDTLRMAIKKLAALKHPLTKKPLSQMGVFAGRVRIICNPADAWALERIIRGELSNAGGIRMVASALPISDILPYGGGIMDGLTWGKETLALPGCAIGTAYIYLPNSLAGFIIDKRPMNMELGRGSVLQLSTEERAWYRVNALHHEWFTGGAETNTNNGEGCVVKVTLPTDS